MRTHDGAALSLSSDSEPLAKGVRLFLSYTAPDGSRSNEAPLLPAGDRGGDGGGGGGSVDPAFGVLRAGEARVFAGVRLADIAAHDAVVLRAEKAGSGSGGGFLPASLKMGGE
eukprot:224582-Chlamydomonas_euryale.AAC.1